MDKDLFLGSKPHRLEKGYVLIGPDEGLWESGEYTDDLGDLFSVSSDEEAKQFSKNPPGGLEDESAINLIGRVRR